MGLIKRKKFFSDRWDAIVYSMDRTASNVTYCHNTRLYEVQWIEEEEQLEND